jgi:Holliday junction resolvase-like predicted endonuclease
VTRSELGQRAELAVADCLFVGGFELLGRNVRFGSLELDVVARKDRLLLVTEVRTRSAGSWCSAFESVTRTKRARVLKAASRLWRERKDWTQGIDRVRVAVAAVTFVDGRTHIEYAPLV